MSANVKARMKQVSDDIDDVVFEVKATDAFVHNTFNKFLMLSQMQFVENRVYDEEEPKADVEVAPASSEVVPESREKVLVPLYTEILKSSTTSLTQRMQLVQEAGEFEDEAYMPKDFELRGNKFCDRKLPVCIGSRRFADDDSLGLYISHVDFGDGAGFGSGGETAIELYYDFAVTPAFHIKPDIQYFVEPSGGSEDSVVGTLRCTLTF
jgi:WASH complex subunit FAM21